MKCESVDPLRPMRAMITPRASRGAGLAAATASYNNTSAVFDALPLPSDATHDDAPVPATYAASDELIKLMKAKPNHVDAMRHLLGTAVNKTSDDGGGRRRASDGPKFAHDDGVRLQALTVLQELVEDLDKAEDFRRAGGFEPLLELLDACCLTSSELRIAEEVAWILGTAAQNQRSLQLHFHEREALLPLARLVIEDASEVEGGEAAKAKFMFAISALTRNCPECQALCEDADCEEAIDAALAEGPRVAAKALVLLTDLLHESLAAKAAEASGRPTYDGHLHAARPAQNVLGESRRDAAVLERAGALRRAAERQSSAGGRPRGESAARTHAHARRFHPRRHHLDRDHARVVGGGARREGGRRAVRARCGAPGGARADQGVRERRVGRGVVRRHAAAPAEL